MTDDKSELQKWAESCASLSPEGRIHFFYDDLNIIQGRVEGALWLLEQLEKSDYPLFGIPAGDLITAEEFRERIGFKQGVARVLEKAKELCGK